MADTLTVTLPAPLAEEVRAMAEAEGLTPEDYVRREVAGGLVASQLAAELDWDEDLRRLDEPGDDIPLEAAFERLNANVVEARAKSR